MIFFNLSYDSNYELFLLGRFPKIRRNAYTKICVTLCMGKIWVGASANFSGFCKDSESKKS